MLTSAHCQMMVTERCDGSYLWFGRERQAQSAEHVDIAGGQPSGGSDVAGHVCVIFALFCSWLSEERLKVWCGGDLCIQG